MKTQKAQRTRKSTSKKNDGEIGHPEIFTTGAFVIPAKVTINDVTQWRWIVTRFEGDSFLDGAYCDPVEHADAVEKMLAPLEDE